MTFRDFFAAVWDREPFPWQERLAMLALEGKWPPVVGLPTAAGKTALIDIAVYALAMRAPHAAKRVFFVVDRRNIVDDAVERACYLAEQLGKAKSGSILGQAADNLREIGSTNEPLIAAILRGGIPRDNSWTDSPLQPAVICSTVDQIGSSLLFRAYGASEYAWPVRAGLTGNDSLIILDEAHASNPFAQTLGWIGKYRSWSEEPLQLPFTVVEMSATPRAGEAFREDQADLANLVLKQRWNAEKNATLVLVEPIEGEEAGSGGFTAVVEGLVCEARRLRDQRGAKVIGVVANRVATARKVHQMLDDDAECEAILITGRSRPYDRNRIWQKWKSEIGLDRPHGNPEKPVFVVGTQTLELGLNLDYDAAASEIASLDALEQRLGRLDRNGNKGLTYASIIAQKDQIDPHYNDPIYGKSLSAVWKWLKGHQSVQTNAETLTSEGGKKPKTKKVKEKFVPVGVLVLRQAIKTTAETDRAALVMPLADAPVLMPAHLDLLCQTSPAPAVEPEPALFLHGPDAGPADVQVIWRQDLGDDTNLWTDIVNICPPNAAEAMDLPVWKAREWIKTKGPVLEWRGPDKSSVKTAGQIRPGTTIIVPSQYGKCDEWGWNPESESDVQDVGDQVKLVMGRPMLRLHPQLTDGWGDAELADRLRSADNVQEARDALLGAISAGAAEWVKVAASATGGGRIKLVGDPQEVTEDWAAVIGKAVFSQESVQSSYTTEVLLEDHLQGCEDWAWKFARELPTLLQSTLKRALREHDIGKADPRMQAWLRGGNPVKSNELIAKSTQSGQNWAAIQRARELSGYPAGGRHELLSVALLAGHAEDFDSVDFDLLLHLIGSHHGRCRPFAPVVEDPDPVIVSHNGWSASSDHGLGRAASGVCERFWLLTRRYGWYGLAYLETLLRLADCRRSEEEEENQKQPGNASHA